MFTFYNAFSNAKVAIEGEEGGRMREGRRTRRGRRRRRRGRQRRSEGEEE